MSHDCCVALPRGAMGLSAVCDCDISLSYSLTFFNCYYRVGVSYTRCHELVCADRMLSPHILKYTILQFLIGLAKIRKSDLGTPFFSDFREANYYNKEIRLNYLNRFISRRFHEDNYLGQHTTFW